MSVVTTYLNDNAQPPLNRFVVYMLCSQLCNKYSDKSNRWNLGLSHSVASTTIGAISNSPSVGNCLSQLTAHASLEWRIFLSPELPIQNGSREQNHAPFRGHLSGTVCRPSAGTSYDHTVHKIWSLYVNSPQRYERWRKMPKWGVLGG